MSGIDAMIYYWLRNKNKFYQYKSPVHLRDIDIEKVLVSNKISFGEKNINTLLVTSLMIIKLSHQK